MISVLVCYDVASGERSGQRRLRKIVASCLDHGVRVQYSVFECKLSEPEWLLLRQRLLGIYDASEDSLRFYFLREDSLKRTEHHGVRPPIDVTAPLII